MCKCKLCILEIIGVNNFFKFSFIKDFIKTVHLTRTL